MSGLLQVAIYDQNGKYITDMDQMENALQNSPYRLDREETKLNDGIAMVIVPSESEAIRLMEMGRCDLPSGCTMEIPS